MENRSLFQRLGGSPGIATLVEDIVGMHMENPVIGARFRPYLEMPEKLSAAKKHLCAFLEAGSGGQAQYTGRTMRDAHRGMNISEAEYIAALDDILAGMRMVAEGVRTTGAALALGARHGVELPIAAQMAEVLAGRVTPRAAVGNLMLRPQRIELDGGS